jgi:hypothetical protein
MSSGRVMFSSAVRVGSRLNAWKTNPSLSRRRWVSRVSDSVVISVSPRKISPEVGASSPAMVWSSVDLPEPDGPMIAVNWPAAKLSETLSSARTAVSSAP